MVCGGSIRLAPGGVAPSSAGYVTVQQLRDRQTSIRAGGVLGACILVSLCFLRVLELMDFGGFWVSDVVRMGDYALVIPGAQCGCIWLLGGGQNLMNEVMGHSTCGAIGRDFMGAVAEVFQRFPHLQATLCDSLGCNVGEFVMLGPQIFANEVMGTWTCALTEGF